MSSMAASPSDRTAPRGRPGDASAGGLPKVVHGLYYGIGISIAIWAVIGAVVAMVA